MPNISKEVFSNLLGENATEFVEALNSAGENQAEIDSITKKYLEDKLMNVRSSAKEEGQKWGTRTSLSSKQKEIAKLYEVDESGMIEDVIKRIIEAKSEGEVKLDAATVRDSEIYKQDLNALREAKATLEANNKQLQKEYQRKELTEAISKYVDKALDGKKTPSERAKDLFKNSLVNSAAEWKVENGIAVPYDSDGYRIKDKMQNDLSGEKLAKQLADDLFLDADSKKEVPKLDDEDNKGNKIIDIPEFDNADGFDNWYEKLSDADKDKVYDQMNA